MEPRIKTQDCPAGTTKRVLRFVENSQLQRDRKMRVRKIKIMGKGGIGGRSEWKMIRQGKNK
jgi:hypothetical protein